MARKLRESDLLKLFRIEATFKAIADGSIASRRGQMDGVSDLSRDGFFALWHDCRRAKDDLNSVGDVTSIDSYARSRYAEGGSWRLSDVVTQAITDLTAVQTEVGTNVLALDVDGYITGQYAKCTDVGPFFSVVVPADYAGTQAAIDTLINGITIEDV